MLLLLTVFTVGIVVTWLIVPRFITPEEAEAIREPPTLNPITALAEVGTLREVLILQAEVRPRVMISIPPWEPIGATRLVVTDLPEPGSIIRSGDLIVGLSGRPLLFVSGMANLYRDLHVGMTGSDVSALQTTLFDLGYLVNADDINAEFDTTTENAVAAWYEDVGYPPAQLAGGVGSGPTGRIILPVDEIVSLPYEALIIERSPYGEGDLVDDRSLVELRTTDTHVVASATFAQGMRLAEGQPALVLVEDIELTSTVADIAAAEPGAASDLVVNIDANLGDVPVRTPAVVEIELRATASEVVSVPLSAIRTGVDGRSYVTVVDGASLIEVEVQTGATIGGRTEIVSGLSGGEKVVVG